MKLGGIGNLDMKALLQEAIARAAARAMEAGAFQAEALPQIVLEVPPRKELGDYATNFALQAARAARMKPRAIAEALTAQLAEPWLERTEIAGPGFINFYLKPDVLCDRLAQIAAAGASYGNLKPQADAGRVQVEYCLLYTSLI